MTQRTVANATTALKAATAVVVPLVCGLAVLGAIGSFTTIRHLAQPWFGPSAWIIPVGIDIGILALLAWDLVDEYLGLPWPPLRWTAWGFIAATVYLNTAASHGDLLAAVMHAAMPVLFVTVIEGIRHLIRQATGLANGTRIERIPAARWMLAPRSSFLLYRQMVLWHVTSYRAGLALEYRRWQAIASLQQQHGRYLWRWRTPLSERLALRSTPPEDMSPPPSTNPSITTTAGSFEDEDKKLIMQATAILRDARRQGRTLSQAALARELRGMGQPIANNRLRWLVRAADPEPPEN